MQAVRRRGRHAEALAGLRSATSCSLLGARDHRRGAARLYRPRALHLAADRLDRRRRSRRCISASCRRAPSRRRALSPAPRSGARLQRRFNLDETTLDQLSLLVSIADQHPGRRGRRCRSSCSSGASSRATSAPGSTGVATGIRIGSFTLSLTGILWGLARLRRRLFPDALVPGLARRLGHGARQGRCRRAQLDPHRRRLCRHGARRR